MQVRVARLDAQLLDPLVQPSALQVLIVDHAEEEPADEADGGDDAPVDHLVVDPRLALELRRGCLVRVRVRVGVRVWIRVGDRD